jgi:cytochrome b6-f complex iron-sulfur subunit
MEPLSVASSALELLAIRKDVSNFEQMFPAPHDIIFAQRDEHEISDELISLSVSKSSSQSVSSSLIFHCRSSPKLTPLKHSHMHNRSFPFKHKGFTMIMCRLLFFISVMGLMHAEGKQRSAFVQKMPTNTSTEKNKASPSFPLLHMRTGSSSQMLPDEVTEEILQDRRRAFLNLFLTSAAVISAPPSDANAFSLGSSSSTPTKKEIKPTTATDIAGSPILAQNFLSKHKSGDRTMVQGLKGDPTYLIVTSNPQNELELQPYALNAECTHLGCVVPWDAMQAKFVCPCHGSQYDAKGSVLRGPAPGSLKLAKVGIEEESGKVLLEPWVETDFRSGEKPWWI